jgi:hypothetical protein
LAIGVTRLALNWNPLQLIHFERPAPWLVAGQTVEFPMALLGLALAIPLVKFKPTGLVIAILVALTATATTLGCSLNSHGQLEARVWLNYLRQRMFWRGNHGESLVVYPRAAKPDGKLVELINNPGARNPSYAELLNFLRQDETDQKPYQLGTWVCACYAEQVHNNAEKAGFVCAFVNLDLGDDLHSCNLFETTDHGQVFVDCTNSRDSAQRPGPPSHDHTVDVRIGQPYVPRFVFPSAGGQETCDSMGTVRSLEISW